MQFSRKPECVLRGLVASVLVSSILLSPFTASAAQNIAASAEFLKQAGIIQGDEGTGALRLDDQINRAELMKIVVAASTDGANAEDFKDCFPDVGREWFARYICWASTHGYIAGYPDGTFAAAKPVNTAEALKIISEVLHLDFEAVRAKSDANVWFDVYVKNAVRQGIIDSALPGAVLGRPATRGEVFDYLFRALQVQTTKTAKFTPAAYEEYRGGGGGSSSGTLKDMPALTPIQAEPRPSTELEQAIIRIMTTQLEQGVENMSMSGNVQMQLELPLYEHSLFLDVDMDKQVKFDGDNWQADMQFTIEAKGYSFANVSGTIVADTTMMADKDTLYLRINAVEASNLTANAPNAMIAFEATEKEAQGNIGKWFSISRRVAEAEVTPFIVLNALKPYVTKTIDVLDSSMRTDVDPYVEIAVEDIDNDSTLSLTFEPTRIVQLIQNIIAYGENRFSPRADMTAANAALTDLADKTQLDVTYDKEDHRVREVSGVVKTTFPGEKGRNFKVDVQFLEEFAYEEVKLDFPTESIALKFLPFVMKYRD